MKMKNNRNQKKTDQLLIRGNFHHVQNMEVVLNYEARQIALGGA